MQITVKNVVVESKGKYKMAVITYSDEKGEGTKKLVSFGEEKDTFLVLASAKEGESFDVELKKIDQFWKWAAATKVQGTPVKTTEIRPSPKSTYETPEERAARQVYIIRQSSLERAIDYFNLVGNKKVEDKDVIFLAGTFTDWVMNGTNLKKDVRDMVLDVDNDVPM